jgi:hypothetical protein
MLPTEFKIREPLPDDVEYLLKTWSREIEQTQPRYADGHSAFPQRLFYDEYQTKVIAPLMRKAHARVVVPTSDVTYIAAFVVANVFPSASTAIVHFAYTRPPFRRLGLATAALEDMGYREGHEIIATHWTNYLRRFKRPDLIFNDLVLYGVIQ